MHMTRVFVRVQASFVISAPMLDTSVQGPPGSDDCDLGRRLADANDGRHGLTTTVRQAPPECLCAERSLI